MELNKLYQIIQDNKLISFYKSDLIINYPVKICKLNRNKIYSQTADFVLNLVDKIDEYIEKNITLKKYNISSLFDELIECLFFYDFEANMFEKEIVVSEINDKLYIYFSLLIKNNDIAYLSDYISQLNFNYSQRKYYTLYKLRTNYKPVIERGFSDIGYFLTILENCIQMSRNVIEFDKKNNNERFSKTCFMMTFNRINTTT